MGFGVARCLGKNQNAPGPSEHPPVRGEQMSKRSGGIKGCKYKTSSWPCYYDKIYLQLIDTVYGPQRARLPIPTIERCHPAVAKDLPSSPRFSPYESLSRSCMFITFTPRQAVVECSYLRYCITLSATEAKKKLLM